VLANDVLPAFGLFPRFRVDSNQVLRALMSDNTTVVNYTAEEQWARMGKPAAGLAFVVRNPVQAALQAVTLLREAGFQADVLGELDTDVPSGSMWYSCERMRWSAPCWCSAATSSEWAQGHLGGRAYGLGSSPQEKRFGSVFNDGNQCPEERAVQFDYEKGSIPY
jgi:hypothetical protein